MDNAEIIKRIDLAQHADRAIHLIAHLEALKADLKKELPRLQIESTPSAWEILNELIIRGNRAKFVLWLNNKKTYPEDMDPIIPFLHFLELSEPEAIKLMNEFLKEAP